MTCFFTTNYGNFKQLLGYLEMTTMEQTNCLGLSCKIAMLG